MGKMQVIGLCKKVLPKCNEPMWSIPDASEKVWDPHQGDVGLRHQRPQKQDVAAVANLTMRRVIAEATGKRIAEYPATIVLLKVSGCVRRNFDDLGALVTRSAIFWICVRMFAVVFSSSPNLARTSFDVRVSKRRH
jgi:hypothetical protein